MIQVPRVLVGLLRVPPLDDPVIRSERLQMVEGFPLAAFLSQLSLLVKT